MSKLLYRIGPRCQSYKAQNNVKLQKKTIFGNKHNCFRKILECVTNETVIHGKIIKKMVSFIELHPDKYSQRLKTFLLLKNSKKTMKRNETFRQKKEIFFFLPQKNYRTRSLVVNDM